MVIEIDGDHFAESNAHGWTLSRRSGPIKVTRSWWSRKKPKHPTETRQVMDYERDGSDAILVRGKRKRVTQHRIIESASEPALYPASLRDVVTTVVRHGIATDVSTGGIDAVQQLTNTVSTSLIAGGYGESRSVELAEGRFVIRHDDVNTQLLINPYRDVSLLPDRVAGFGKSAVAYCGSLRQALWAAADCSFRALDESIPLAESADAFHRHALTLLNSARLVSPVAKSTPPRLHDTVSTAAA